MGIFTRNAAIINIHINRFERLISNVLLVINMEDDLYEESMLIRLRRRGREAKTVYIIR